MTIPLFGYVDPKFQPIQKIFQTNFEKNNEIGAALSIIHKGELVLNLWGGYKNLTNKDLWDENTLVNTFSITKTITTLCILLLVDQKKIEFDSTISKYWPEFAQNGKEGITIRQVLCHSSGIPGFTPKISLQDLYNWEKIIHIIETERPLWSPGTQIGYHIFTMGYILGEIILRITGKTVGTFFNQEIAKPLGIDFFIGVKPQDQFRTATLYPETIIPSKFQFFLGKFLFQKSFQLLSNPIIDIKEINGSQWKAAEIPAGNGQGNALALAQIGSIISNWGNFGQKQIFSKEIITEAIKEQIRGKDKYSFYREKRWGLGFGLYNPKLLLGSKSIYCSGMGGSTCIIDLDEDLSIGYTMNRMAGFFEGDSRILPIVKEVWNIIRKTRE